MIRSKLKRSPKPAPAPIQPAATRETIVTWAEQAECTCPELCDRDHEQD